MPQCDELKQTLAELAIMTFCYFCLRTLKLKPDNIGLAKEAPLFPLFPATLYIERPTCSIFFRTLFHVVLVMNLLKKSALCPRQIALLYYHIFSPNCITKSKCIFHPFNVPFNWGKALLQIYLVSSATAAFQMNMGTD